MRKILFTIVVGLFTFSCNQSDDTPTKDYSKQIQSISRLNKSALDFSTVKLNEFLSKGENGEILFDQRGLASSSLNFLNGKYFYGTNFEFWKITENFETINLLEMFKENANGRTKAEDFNTFTWEQLELALPFIDNLYSINSLSDVNSISYAFTMQVANSTLSEPEKWDLFSLSSSAANVAYFIDNGGTEVIYQELVQSLGDPNDPSFGGRVKGCSVDWRGVWASAVVGLAGGAVSGAYVGCTGGTVVFPGLGTATGCVGGAVLGGATGFIGGALGGVAANLLTTCFR